MPSVRILSVVRRRLMGPLAIMFALVLASTLSLARPASSEKPPDGQAIFRFDTFGDE